MAGYACLADARNRVYARLVRWEQALADTFRSCFANNIETTVTENPDGTVFVITGDIPAMWLRDSLWQVMPYLPLAREDEEVRSLIARVVQRQAFFVTVDPYANAFNNEANGHAWDKEDLDQSPWVWERKYEIDSLCAPLLLGHQLWKATDDSSFFDETYHRMVRAALNVFTREQHHETSEYRFVRDNGVATDTLTHDGRGAPVGYTGMTWSGFRPSDDSCDFGYLVPANMMAVVALRGAAEIAGTVFSDAGLSDRLTVLASAIETGIETYGKVEHPEYGTIYAYETDGLGHYNLMDDANIPSLLSIPLLGYRDASDETYRRTRAFILSDANPWYFRGPYAKGIGSPHTGPGLIWPMALAVQILTSSDDAERLECLLSLRDTTAGTQLMHESFNPDDPNEYTRPWFGWANSLFSMVIQALVQDGFFDRVPPPNP